jgi:multiple sugar transport system substrate-binding protein
VIAGLVLAGCSGGDVGDPAARTSDLTGRGPITYVQGKDNNDVVRPALARWNKAHPDEHVTLKEQSDNAGQQHDDIVQHFQAQDDGYDVVTVDVVWTAEFAARGWLQPLEGDLALDMSRMLPQTVETGRYRDVQFAAPQTSDGGLLYYRSDLVATPPATWDEMMEMCSIARDNAMGCYAGQFSKYEGLTANVSEAIATAGGTVVGDDGTTPTVDSPEAAKGLGMLVDAYKDGNIPPEAMTYQEEQGRMAFENGKLLFLNNWPYVYSIAATEGSSTVKGKFAVAPLPGVDGPGASTLGGHDLAISVYSKHKATAHDFVAFMQSEEIQRMYVEVGSLAPVIGDLYDDPDLIDELPYLPTLKTSIENAVPRPITPFYPAVTRAIQDNAYAAMTGAKSVDTALADMQASIATASR